MSSPNVANLAGKIWAINPDLSVEDVKNYIISYSDVSEDGRIILINPKALSFTGKTLQSSVRWFNAFFPQKFFSCIRVGL